MRSVPFQRPVTSSTARVSVRVRVVRIGSTPLVGERVAGDLMRLARDEAALAFELPYALEPAMPIASSTIAAWTT